MLWFVTKWRTHHISFCEIICIWVQMHLSNAGVNCISMEYEVVGSVLGVTAGTRITNANLRQSIYPMFLQCAYNVLTMCDVWGHGSPMQIFGANWVMHTVQSFWDAIAMFLQFSHNAQCTGTRVTDTNVHLMFLNVLTMFLQCSWSVFATRSVTLNRSRNLQCQEQHDDNSAPFTTV